MKQKSKPVKTKRKATKYKASIISDLGWDAPLDDLWITKDKDEKPKK